MKHNSLCKVSYTKEFFQFTNRNVVIAANCSCWLDESSRFLVLRIKIMFPKAGLRGFVVVFVVVIVVAIIVLSVRLPKVPPSVTQGCIGGLPSLRKPLSKKP